MFSILKVVLPLFWFFPYLYMFVDIYWVIDTPLPLNIFKFLIIIPCLASLILIFIWFVEFNYIHSIVKAFNSLKANNSELLSKYLKFAPELYEKDGKTLLNIAIDAQVDSSVIVFLIKKGFFVINSEDLNYNVSYSLFYLCSNYDYLDEHIVKSLVKYGADVDFIDNHGGILGLSLLQILVLRQHKDSIHLLLESGCNVDYIIPDLNMDALMLAAKFVSDPNIINLLLQYGANVNVKGGDGYNCILYCAQYNKNPVILNVLVKAGARLRSYSVYNDIFKNNTITPLFVACMFNNIHMVERLVILGDDLSFRDNTGMNALLAASSCNPNADVVKFLLDSGMDIDRSRDNDGNTPLMGASLLNPSANVIKYLINRTHNLQSKNKDGLDFIDFLKQNTHLSLEEKETILNKWL
jgi:ankyrin repeat protein